MQRITVKFIAFIFILIILDYGFRAFHYHNDNLFAQISAEKMNEMIEKMTA